MIVYRDHQRRNAAPAWLAGAPDLVRRDADICVYWGIGAAYLCGPQDLLEWVDVGDGYSATIVGELDCAALYRAQQWCEVAPGPDLHGRAWMLPAPLSPEGNRAFRVAYGPDYLPKLTDQQTRVEAIANAARHALTEAHCNDTPLPMKIACAWTAELIASMNYISKEALGALGLIDDVLVAAALYGCSGISAMAKPDE